ncbi:Aldo/keto reductase [Gonapodya prolifera JEL478]|uniref:Aldo/keto reductase n=1 Tax=Gonapodya prolifera (strain JEL478) TaxID=1344416 RepID=A0A139A0G2_GONPJ|nr:Aldo/keto reductase [Gonapodya prolifera JEL478]|eukprot:KXS10222.1 Aldo/keto reductase [Gonapodya prolifera JEL478]
MEALVQLKKPFALNKTAQLNLLGTAKGLGTAVVAYSLLGRGMLSGTIKFPSDFRPTDLRKYLPRFFTENFLNNLETVETIAAFARRKGCAPSQLTLAWLLKQDESVIPIPGTTSVERLKENFGALSVSLSDEESAEIRRAVEAAEIARGRYPESVMADMYADTPVLAA